MLKNQLDPYRQFDIAYRRVTDRQTDRDTTTAYTALTASCGKITVGCQ